jgi:hypothetical protein
MQNPLVSSGSPNNTIVDDYHALDHRKWWRIDRVRVPAPTNRQYEISPEHNSKPLLSLQALQMQLKYIGNKHSIIKSGERLTEIATPPNQNMSNISRTHTCTPLVSSGLWNDIVNKPSMIDMGGYLTELEYTPLLEHSMSDISRTSSQSQFGDNEASFV